jgi:DegV family protein with EDD domain
MGDITKRGSYMGTAIVTDSTSDIPDELVERLNIYVMRNYVIIGDKSYEDGVDITRKEFYEQLPSMKDFPTTATASAGAYADLYESLLHKGAQNILSIHPSAFLSGILNAANAAAQSFQGRVSVIDSRFISSGLGHQVVAAAEAAVRGVPVPQIIQMLDLVRQRSRVVAMLDTLEFIRRSGRVSWAKASLGSLLSIKPFVDVKDGQVVSMGDVRTRRKGITRLINLIHELGPLERLAVLHTNAEEDARALLDQLKNERLNPANIVNVTTIIGSHVGPNGLGYAVVTA